MSKAALLISLATFVAIINADETCPHPWTVARKENGTTTCECGDTLGGVVKCDSKSFEVQLLQAYCMTSSDNVNAVVGHCASTFLKLTTNIVNNVSDLNDAMCGHLNRTGQMCGGCKEGHAPPVYSYSLACVECIDYKYNWLKYIAIALLPLTLFYISVLTLRISALSGNMDVVILLSQLMCSPGIMQLYGLYLPSLPTAIHYISLITLTFHGIWNLDFFRLVYKPFCLHPHLTTLQILVLDYVIAVYPLVLIVITSVCIYLHDNYRIVVLLWSPFHRCFTHIRREWHIRKSLVDVFATFLLLSYVKILNVSACILTPTVLYDAHGEKLLDYVIYYDGTVKFFSVDHIPYAVLAIIMLLLFNITPMMLLYFYPCRIFQHCLNHCPCQLQALHTFMDAFQGSFKTAPYDCRYFAASYLLFRIFNIFAQCLLQNSLYLPLIGSFFFFFSLVVSYVKPRRHHWYNLVDLLLLTSMGFSAILFFFMGEGIFYVAPLLSLHGNQLLIFVAVLANLPCLHLTMLLVYSLTPSGVRNWCKKHRSRHWRFCQARELQMEGQNEQTALLNNH